MAIKISNISCKFKDYLALDDVNLEIKNGELVALLGPSGSGKTTLLRVIAGLETPNTGSIINDNVEINNKSPFERGVGFVFQHYALFRHMTVFENVAFGLRMLKKEKRPKENEIAKKVDELLRLVHLEHLKDRYPKHLSGGQRQRVALVRSLAVAPKVLLLDEPFAALDFKVRKELRRWLRTLHKTLNITTIIVTHDQEEAMEVADKVVVMSEGKIEQIGSPFEVYNKPSNSFVYDFLGNFNVFLGWKNEDNEINIIDYQPVERITKKSGWFKKGKFVSKIFKLFRGDFDELNKNIESQESGHYVEIFVRPHDMEIITENDKDDNIEAKIVHINQVGAVIKLELERKDGSIIYVEITKEIMQELELEINQNVYVKAKEFTVFE